MFEGCSGEASQFLEGSCLEKSVNSSKVTPEKQVSCLNFAPEKSASCLKFVSAKSDLQLNSVLAKKAFSRNTDPEKEQENIISLQNYIVEKYRVPEIVIKT